MGIWTFAPASARIDLGNLISRGKRRSQIFKILMKSKYKGNASGICFLFRVWQFELTQLYVTTVGDRRTFCFRQTSIENDPRNTNHELNAL